MTEVGHCATCTHRRQEPLQSWRCEECEHKGAGCFEGENDIAWYCDICELYVPPDGFCHFHSPW